jgi:hypothetical protein
MDTKHKALVDSNGEALTTQRVANGSRPILFVSLRNAVAFVEELKNKPIDQARIDGKWLVCEACQKPIGENPDWSYLTLMTEDIYLHLEPTDHSVEAVLIMKENT